MIRGLFRIAISAVRFSRPPVRVRFFIILSALSVLTAASFPSRPPARETGLSARNGNWAETLREVEKCQTSDPVFYEQRRGYLLHAWLLAKTGRTEDALRIYEQWKLTDRLFQDYIFMEEARLLATTGKSSRARQNFFSIVRLHPNSPYFQQAFFNLAQSYERDGKLELAANTYTSIANRIRSRRGDAWLALLKLQIQLGSWRNAAETLEKILTVYDSGSLLAEACRLAADRAELRPALERNEARLLLVASTLVTNRDLDLAFPLLQKLQQKFKQSPQQIRHQYWMGRYYFLSGNYEQGLTWYRRAGSGRDRTFSVRARKGMVRILQIQNKSEEALAILKEMARQPIPEAADAWLWQYDILRRAGRTADAIQCLRKGVAQLPAGRSEEMRYHLGLAAGKSGDHQGAAEQLTGLLATLPFSIGGDLPSRPEASFFLGLALENTGRIDAAADAWLAYPFRRDSYYSQLSMEQLPRLFQGRESQLRTKTEACLRRFREQASAKREDAALEELSRLQLLSGNPKYWDELLPQLPGLAKQYKQLAQLAELPHETGNGTPLQATTPDANALFRATIFQALGLATPAAAEYARCNDAYLAQRLGISQTEAAARKALTLARLFHQAGNFTQAHSWAGRLLRHYPACTPYPVLNQEALGLYYPLAFRDQIISQAQAVKVDPYFIYGIILQESRFNPEAVSGVSARGLMQLMPETARRVAAAARIAYSGRPAELFDPVLNLRLGTQYLRGLFTQLGHPAVVAAAYNAGETQAETWKTLAGEPLDLYYIPEVDFIQTRGYIEHVLANARIYQTLYPELNREK